MLPPARPLARRKSASAVPLVVAPLHVAAADVERAKRWAAGWQGFQDKLAHDMAECALAGYLNETMILNAEKHC
jgi:hypothetical protein